MKASGRQKMIDEPNTMKQKPKIKDDVKIKRSSFCALLTSQPGAARV